MTLLYHFPLQETTEVSKVKGTRYKEDDDGVLTAVGEITIDSNDSSDQPLSDFSKPVTDGIDDIVETLADLVLSVSLPQTSGTFKHFAYVSNNDLSWVVVLLYKVRKTVIPSFKLKLTAVTATTSSSMQVQTLGTIASSQTHACLSMQLTPVASLGLSSISI